MPHRTAPYQGLMPYLEGDADYFFGRDRDGRVIAANLVASRLTIVYGESGVGKSSVLRAKVAPGLEAIAQQNLDVAGAAELAVVVVSSWLEPVDAIRAQITAHLGDAAPEGASIEELLRLLGAAVGGRVLVILDQFEDYFLYHPDDDGDGSFAVTFSGLVEKPDLRANFLISVREDTLAKLDRFKGRIAGLFDNYVRVDRLSIEAARAAIVEPVRRYNALLGPGGQHVEIEDGFADGVIRDLTAGDVALGTQGVGAASDGDGKGVETPYLQLVLTRLWAEQHSSGSRKLSLGTLEALGGAGEILRGHVGAVMSAFALDEQDVAARVFRYLVTPSGTKIAHSVHDLAGLAQEPPERVDEIVQRLATGEARILRPVAAVSPGPTEGRFEIFHDVLAKAVLDWRTRFVADHARRAAEELQRKELWNRFFRILALALLVAVIGTAALTVLALRERGRAREGEASARASSLVANSLAQLPVDPELSVLLAREAVARKPTDAAANALALAVSEDYTRAVMRGHAGAVFMRTDGSAFTPDGRRVVTASDDGTAAIWDLASGRRLDTLHARGGIVSASFSPDGRHVVTADGSGTARTFDARSGGSERTLRGHRARVWDARYSSDGLRIVTASQDDTARVWSAGGGRALRTFRMSSSVFSARFDGTGKRVLTAQEDGSVRLLDVATGRQLRRLGTTRPYLTSVSFDPAGRRVLTSDGDAARTWDVSTGRRLAVLRHPRETEGAAYSPDGRRIVTIGRSTARIWSASGRPGATLAGHTNTVMSAVFSPDGRLVVTASDDGTARVWDATSGGLLRELRGHGESVNAAAFTPSGETVVTASDDRTARVWDVDAGKVLRGAGDWMTSVAFSPDGRTLAAGGADGAVRLWNVDTGHPLAVGHQPQFVNTVAFGADGRSVIAADADGNVTTWDRAGRRKSTFTAGGQATAAAVSPDGTKLVTAAETGEVRVWDVRSRRLRLVFRHPGWVMDAAFSPDGSRIVTAGLDRTARIWDAASGAQRAVLRGHDGGVYAASFSPDGRLVVTAGGDKTARLWSASTGHAVRVFSVKTARVTSAAFTGDGQRIVTGDVARTTRVWDTRTGRQVAVMQMHAAGVNDVAVSRHGIIASVSDDGTARLYRCPTCGSLSDLEAFASRISSRGLSPSERKQFLEG